MKMIGSITALIAASLMMGTFAHAGEVSRLASVISGKFSRAGSTNRQQLSDSALRGLCEDGYTLAMFVYPGATTRTVSCSGGREIKYMSKGSFSNPASILSAAKAEMDNGGKVLVHCWYGVHAAKYVAAAALNKFCGYTGDQAAEYFKNGIPPGSLSTARIEELANRLRAYGNGGSVMQGCP